MDLLQFGQQIPDTPSPPGHINVCRLVCHVRPDGPTGAQAGEEAGRQAGGGGREDREEGSFSAVSKPIFASK